MTDPTRPATGYPAQPTNGYPPPPPPQPQPQPQHQQPSNYYYPNYNNQQQYYHAPPPPPPPRAVFFRRFMSALIATFIIFGVILFIVWLVLRPRVPIFTVDSLSLSSLNLSTTPTSQISATWTVHLTVTNPNSKLHVYYDEIIARIYYKSSFLTQNQLPPFDQRTKDQTAITARLVATSAYISPELVTDFNGDRSKGSVKFDVQMIAVVRFNSGGWRARRRYLRVLCDDLPLSVTVNGSNGTLTGGSKRCAALI